MKYIVALVAFALIGSAFGQDAAKPTKPKHAPKVVKADSKPVTQAEARATFLKLRKLVAAAAKTTVPAKSGFAVKTQPATRAQIVEEMYATYVAFQPTLKFKPKPLRVDDKVILIKDRATKMHLRELIQLGFAGRVSPLVTGPKDTMTVAEFGDAVGFYMARLAQLAHLPSTRWTPMLSGGID